VKYRLKRAIPSALRIGFTAFTLDVVSCMISFLGHEAKRVPVFAVGAGMRS
jgi:hypothetical protein